MPPKTTPVQHLHGKLQRKIVNEYNAIPGMKYIISMVSVSIWVSCFTIKAVMVGGIDQPTLFIAKTL